MYTLLGAEVSLYTGKVRAYLRYKRIPFTEVVASAEVYRTVIIPKTGVSYIPLLLTPDGETAVQDTTDIIDFLERRFPANPIYPATPCQRLVSLLFEVYADEWLVIPAMHYRWSFPENLDFIYREFGRTNLPDASASAQYEQGKKVAAKFAGSLPFLGVSDQTKAAIEEWFETFLGQLDAHFAQHAFLLGGRPTLGDFGLMGPLYAHISRDPYPGRLLRAKAPHVIQWLERMQFNHPPGGSGGLLPNDSVPHTLLPILQHMFDEHLPVVVDTMARLSEFCRGWGGAAGSGRIPRALGWHDFTVGGAKGRRLVYPYTVWMFQRPLDFWASLSREEKEAVEARVLFPLRGGRERWAAAVRAAGQCRVRRENNVIVWDTAQHTAAKL